LIIVSSVLRNPAEYLHEVIRQKAGAVSIGPPHRRLAKLSHVVLV
jgi:hypothetical protein